MKALYPVILLFCFSFKQNEHDPLLYQESSGSIVNHKSYVLCYDDSLKYTKWVSYILTDKMLLYPVCKRTGDFRPDTLVKNSPELLDYINSGYDRGHLVNAHDMRFDSLSESESFYLTNISPQIPSFNRGIWKQLETQTRKWTLKHKKLLVITGGILKDSIKFIGNCISVPSHFYKIIFDSDSNKAIAFIVENISNNLPLKTYTVSIDLIEKETKIDFLQLLEDSLEARIEAQIDTTWF